MLVRSQVPDGTCFTDAATEPVGPPRQGRWNRDTIVDYGERVVFGALFLNFVITMLPNLAFEPSAALLVASESLTGILIVIRKRGRIATQAYPFFLALIGSAAAWLILPSGVAVINPILAGILMLAGLAITVSAKVCLGRSFGVVPANRGVKQLGPYRFVRHPMYLGYLVNQVGYLLACASVWNSLVYAVAWTMLVLRIAEEEKILGEDPVYGQYRARVRSKLIPGIF